MPEAERSWMSASELRRQATSRLAEVEAEARPELSGPPTEAERQATLHELRVHQIELEMQNEELRRAQLELEASRQRWFELYDLAPVGYCTVSEGGLVLQVNLAAAELFGQPRASLAMRRFSEFVLPADRRTFFALHAQLLGSLQPQSCELRLLEVQGAPRWVELTAAAAEPDAQGRRSLRIVLRDVSAQRQAQAAEAALRLSEQTQRHRSELLSRVGHEFRTPLNAIIGFSNVLLSQDDLALPTESRRQLQHILEAGRHLLQMVMDLVDVSRAESGRLALQMGEVDLLGVLQDALRAVASQAQAAGVTLTLEPDAPSMAVVAADPTRVRQVLLNLLTNAIKYNHAGGRVTARLERSGEFWRLHVVDDGMGMTLQQQADLFQPFNRLGRESVGIEGTGLGLVIARDLVQAMGGRLTVHSEPEWGSEFLVDLKASDAARHERQAPTATSQLRLRTDVKGRVLCVEDDPASRDLIKTLLDQRPGVEVEIVDSGASCIAAARRRWPDLLLLDLRLPDMAGLDVLKVLRQLNPHLPLHCIVVSAECSATEVAASRAAGADDLLDKPVDPAAFLSILDRRLARAVPPADAPPGDPPLRA